MHPVPRLVIGMSCNSHAAEQETTAVLYCALAVADVERVSARIRAFAPGLVTAPRMLHAGIEPPVIELMSVAISRKFVFV